MPPEKNFNCLLFLLPLILHASYLTFDKSFTLINTILNIYANCMFLHNSDMKKKIKFFKINFGSLWSVLVTCPLHRQAKMCLACGEHTSCLK